MAGTRLVIQLAFLLEFLVLIGIAAYFGLCRNNDVICTPIFGQGGRSRLVLPPEWNTQHGFHVNEKESKSLRRYKLHVTLVLEDGSDWNVWASMLDSVLLKSKLAKHPCLVGPIQTELSLEGNLSENSHAIINDTNNITEYQVSGSTVKQWLTRRRNHHDTSRLDVLFYVPVKSRMPLYVKFKQSEAATALTYGQQVLTIVETNDNNNNITASESATAYVDPFLKQQCQLTSNSTLWWRRLAHETQERAKKLVLVNYNLLKKSSLKVPITKEVRTHLF